MARAIKRESLSVRYQQALDADRIMDRRGVLLTTARLRLRLPTPDDLDFLVGLDIDPEVMRYIHDGPMTEKESRQFAESTIVVAAYSLSFHKWIVERRDDQTCLGWVELTKFRQGHRRSDLGDDIQIGYEFATHAWGQGYATEACVAVLDYAFNQSRLDRLVAFARLDNQRSLNVLSKLGFTQDGFCLDGAKANCGFFVLPRKSVLSDASVRSETFKKS